MIVTRTEESRRFIGRLDEGADLITSLADVCRQHRITCGEIRGSGYVRNARPFNYDAAARKLTVPEEPMKGPFTVAGANGTASQQDDDTTVHLYGTLVGPDGALVSGRLASAEVIVFEFVISAFDDIVLIRSQDKQNGLDQWLQLKAANDASLPDGPDSAEALREDLDENALNELDDVAANPGDILEHPRFGRCIIVHQADEDRLSVRLENQRVVDLHLGLVRLSIARREGDATVYRARILKKH